jgi:hypothetical protein
VAAISDFRSDSPLHLICVGWVYLSSFEVLNLGLVFRVVRIEKFWCHDDASGVHGPRSVQNPSSQTRNCFRRHSSQWFSASIGLRYAGVTAVLQLSPEFTDIPRRHCPSLGLVVTLWWVSMQLLNCFGSSATWPHCSYDIASKQCKRREFIMHQSRGAVSFTPLFTTDDIGLRKDASVEHVVKVFLNVGEAMAARWIEMPKGILLLQAVPDQPASGAIYLYDRERHIFFFVDFVDGRDDTMTAAEFDQLVAEYDLVSWTANPAFLPAGTGTIAMA